MNTLDEDNLIKDLGNRIKSNKLIGIILTHFITNNILEESTFNSIRTDKYTSTFSIIKGSLVKTTNNQPWLEKWQIKYGNIVTNHNIYIKINDIWKEFLLRAYIIYG